MLPTRTHPFLNHFYKQNNRFFHFQLQFMLIYTRLSYCKIIRTLKLIDSSMNCHLNHIYGTAGLFILENYKTLNCFQFLDTSRGHYVNAQTIYCTKSLSALTQSMCTISEQTYSSLRILFVEWMFIRKDKLRDCTGALTAKMPNQQTVC